MDAFATDGFTDQTHNAGTRLKVTVKVPPLWRALACVGRSLLLTVDERSLLRYSDVRRIDVVTE